MHLLGCLLPKWQGITNASEDAEKGEHLYPVGGCVTWYRHYGKQYERSSRKIELPYDLAIPLWGIYLKVIKWLPGRDCCTTNFIAALFDYCQDIETPKYLMTDEWIKKMWYMTDRATQ